jgi:hypothetical protein
MRQKYFWLKLVGTAFLLHVILILLSIIEVAIYSYLINPGHEDAFYRAHATESGPWISGIVGSLLMFFLTGRFTKIFSLRQLTYAIGLPVTYIIIDILIVLPFGIDWTEHLPVFLSANGAKIIASLVAYFKFKIEETTIKPI